MKKSIFVYTPFYTLPKEKKDLFQDTKAIEYLISNSEQKDIDITVIHTYLFSYRNLMKFFKYIIYYIFRYKTIVNNTTVYFMPNIIRRPRGYKPSKMIIKSHIRRLVKNITNKPNLEVYHLPTYYTEYVKESNCKKIAVVHSYDIKAMKKFKTKSYWIRYYSQFDDIYFRSIIIQEEFNKILKNKNDDENKIVYSGIPEYMIRNVKNKSCYNKKPTMTFIGRIDKNKNLQLIIDALKEIKLDYKFKVIGEGPEYYKIKNQNKNQKQIEFKGYLSRENTMKELEKSDIFIMLSKKETFGLVYLEALAKNNIIIATKGQGIDGYICNNFNGFLVDINNFEEVVSKIKKALTLSCSIQEFIRKNGNELVRELTDKKASENYYEIIRRNV